MICPPVEAADFTAPAKPAKDMEPLPETWFRIMITYVIIAALGILRIAGAVSCETCKRGE
jgi:hypothetical protein